MTLKPLPRPPAIVTPMLPEGRTVSFLHGKPVVKGPNQWVPRVLEGGGIAPQKLPFPQLVERCMPGSGLLRAAILVAGAVEAWWAFQEDEPQIIDTPPAATPLTDWLAEMRELATLTQLIAEKELRAFQLEKMGLTVQARQLRNEIDGLTLQLHTATRTYPLIHGALQMVASANSDGAAQASGGGDTAASTRVGAPPLDDAQYLLEHIGAMLYRGEFGDSGTIQHGLTVAFGMLLSGITAGPSANTTHRLLAVAHAGRAANLFFSNPLLATARREAMLLPEPVRDIMLAGLDVVDTRLHPYQLPEHLLAQLREAIQQGQEMRAEELVDLLSLEILRICRSLVETWKDENKVAFWAGGKIREIIDTMEAAATSLTRRGIVHDLRANLGSLDSRIRLEAMQGLEALGRISSETHLQGISRDLSEIAAKVQKRTPPSVMLIVDGLDGEHLADTVDGRQLLIALRNLVANAGQNLRAGQTKVDVRIALVKRPGENMIVVADNGAGMSPETQQNLLSGTPVHNGQVVDQDNPREFRSFGWTRIRAACAKLGITPEIESTPNAGTTVKLHLPRGLLVSDGHPPLTSIP